MNRQRKAVFALLYFSEGCPIGFVWWAMPTWLRGEGVELAAITGLTAMLILPWTLKFLWAPLVDSWRGARFGLRGWIVTMQLLMAAAFVPLALLDPVADLSVLKWFLLAHAICAATQDVAIDALAIRTVAATQRGELNGWMQAGMLGGRSLFGGGALLLIAQFGPAWVVGALIACIVLTSTLVWTLDEPAPPVRSDAGVRNPFADLAGMRSNRRLWWAIGFALTAGAGFEAVGALAGPFLIDHAVSETAIGWFFGVPVVLATAAGGLVGGRTADRIGHRRAVAAFLASFVLCILLIAALDALCSAAVAPAAWFACLTVMYFCIGLFIAASYALFMDVAEPAHGGTQFSACMAATNGCEAWSAWSGGQLAGRFGFAAAFAALSAVSLASLAVLRRLPARADAA